MSAVNLLALSTGEKKEPLSAYALLKGRLACAHRKLARMVRRSRNWMKQKRKINKLHSRIADMRNDHLHKISTELSKNHALVFVEDLPVKDMTASAQGTVERPGSNVKRKSALNTSILDQGLVRAQAADRV